MTTQIQDPTSAISDTEWLAALEGKTIRGVRPTHDNGPVPDVNLLFTDDTAFTLSVKPGVYFEGCLINTLRKAQPIMNVLVVTDGFGSWSVEIRSRTFPLMQLLAVNKDNPTDEFPFELVAREKSNG
jgi:hypothetical protein